MKNFLYTLDGHTPVPCDDALKWAASGILRDISRRRVAETVIGEYVVSTIFTGINSHPFYGLPPQVFETAIFSPDHVEIQERYATWEEALAGHEQIVLQYRKEG